MEVMEVSGEKSFPIDMADRVRVRKKTLQAVIDQCQRALLESITAAEFPDTDQHQPFVSDADEGSSAPSPEGSEAEQLCDLLKSRIECPDFLDKLESVREEGAWDMVGEKDLWEGGNSGLEEDDYVLVRQEDIVDGIACFMAAYLLSLKETKDLTPNQIQDALSKTFSLKKKKGKLRKAWDGSKVIYNVASWGATAIGIYQNPAILRAASAAFWTSCHVISKLL